MIRKSLILLIKPLDGHFSKFKQIFKCSDSASKSANGPGPCHIIIPIHSRWIDSNIPEGTFSVVGPTWGEGGAHGRVPTNDSGNCVPKQPTSIGLLGHLLGEILNAHHILLLRTIFPYVVYTMQCSLLKCESHLEFPHPGYLSI